jgi:hypothetical protein
MSNDRLPIRSGGTGDRIFGNFRIGTVSMTSKPEAFVPVQRGNVLDLGTSSNP